MKKIINCIAIIIILVSFMGLEVRANELKQVYTKEDYIQLIELINDKYDVQVLYCEEYVETQITPQDLYDVIISKLQDTNKKYEVYNSGIKRTTGEGVCVVEKFPIVSTVTYTFYYDSARNKEYFSSCSNVSSVTSNGAALCNVVFEQNRYTANVLDSGRTLAVKVYGTYSDYSSWVPVRIEDYEVRFEIAYTSI